MGLFDGDTELGMDGPILSSKSLKNGEFLSLVKFLSSILPFVFRESILLWNTDVSSHGPIWLGAVEFLFRFSV